MPIQDHYQLTVDGLTFLSRHDEDAFFEWLGKESSVISFGGEGKSLRILVGCSVVGEYDLRELIALFFRYGIDMRQFRVFDHEPFSRWLRNSEAYWFEAIFGT